MIRTWFRTNGFSLILGWIVLVSFEMCLSQGLAQGLDWWEEESPSPLKKSSPREEKRIFEQRMNKPFGMPDNPSSSSKPQHLPLESTTNTKISSEPSPTQQSCEQWTRPLWYSHRDQAGKFAGVGGPESTADDAEAKARLAIVKSIELAIVGDDSFYQEETTGGDLSYAVRSSVVEKVNLSVTGLEIQEVVVDPCTNQFYALATLNITRASSAWKRALRDLESQITELKRQIASYDEQGEAFRMLLGLERLLLAQETGKHIAQRLAYVAEQVSDSTTWAARVVHTQHRQETILESLHLRKISGDRQRAIESAQLPNPLILQLVMGEKPVPRVPISLTVVEGAIQVPGLVWTDEQGLAQIPVRYREATEEGARVVTAVALDQVSYDYLPSLRERVHDRAQQFTAQFDILPPLYHVVNQLRFLSTQAEELKARVVSSRKEKALFEVMTYLHQLTDVQDRWLQLHDALVRQKVSSSPTAKEPGESRQTRRELEGLLTAIVLKKAQGDGQEATLNEPLPLPLGIAAIAALPEGEILLPNMPVQFAFVQGTGKVEEHLQTGMDGQAHARVHQVNPQNQAVSVVATFDVETLDPPVPAALQDRLRAHLHQQQVQFTINPPWDCSASNPFDKAVYQLACELAAKASEAEGKTTTVKDFTERQSGKRYELSIRVERAIERALARTGRLKVAAKTRTRGLDRSSIAGAVISGQYWAEKDGVRIQADLKYQDTSGSLFQDWDAEAFIPREYLTKEEFASLTGSHHLGSQMPLPTQMAATSHQAWVREFWNLHNPRPSFRTELKPERLTYEEGDSAIFRFKTERDCYLWVISIGASGNGVVLYPNVVKPNIQNTLIRARDGWVNIPATSWKFTYQIGPPFGSERVKTICTTQPVQLIPSSKYHSQLYQFTPGNEGFRNLVMEERSKQPEGYEWSEAQTSIKTLEKGQMETRDRR